jgi:membrane fusion protein
MIAMTTKPSLYRNSAIQAAGHRWFSAVSVVTPPTMLPAMIIALGALACLALAAVVIEIPERVPAAGVLLPSKGLLKVRVRQSGWVEEVRVTNGAVVAEGQPLLRLIDAERAPEREPASTLRLASLRSEVELLDIAVRQELTTIDGRIRHHQRRMRLLDQRLQAARQEHDTRAQESALQDELTARLDKLAGQGLVARQRAEDAAAEALKVKATCAEARQRLLGLQEALVVLQQQLEDDAGAAALLRTRGKIRQETILREIAAVEMRSATEITAPGEGVVAGLSVRQGSYVQSGEVIMTLHDPADRLEARLYVSARNAAMIATGQRVELQLQAYPKQLFGTQSAVITAISTAALQAQEFGAPTTVQGTVFEIRARLDSTQIRARGRAWQLPPGTTFTADLVRRRWPLFRWLFRGGDDAGTENA